MLTGEQVAVLIKYYQSVQLSGEQKDRLIEKYWEANGEDRQEIARAYAHLFANDAEFVQRLMFYHDHYISNRTGSYVSVRKATQGYCSEDRGPTSPSPFSRCSGQSTCSVAMQLPKRLTHAQRLVRTAIQDQFPKLTGPGPYSLRFALVMTEAERKEVIDLYASQFEYPDPQELQKLVTLPQSLSTRTRKRINGSYTWYIRCETTGEVVSAVTVTVHHHQTHRFVEMPLFATAAGYKRNGFGRLLNAALATWCQRKDFEFIMISADVQAIPFWRHLGYDRMSKRERNGIAFFYEHECYKFKGAEPMIGYCRNLHTCQSSTLTPLVGDTKKESSVQHCSAQPSNSLYNQQPEVVLQSMPKFVVLGPLELA